MGIEASIKCACVNRKVEGVVQARTRKGKASVSKNFLTAIGAAQSRSAQGTFAIRSPDMTVQQVRGKVIDFSSV
jgi:hypothetical protein